MRQLTRIVNKWKHSEGEDWSVIGKNGKIVAPQRVPVVFFTPVEVGGFEKFNMIKVCKQIAGIVKGGIGEPKLTRNGYLMIAAESEEGRASLLKIAKLGALPVKAEESKRTTVLKGKIIGVHPSITVETVKETLERQGVAEVARLKYRDHQYGYLKNTDQVILTFAGTTAPDSVILGMKQHAVILYWEPIQCYKCYEFGHKSVHCEVRSPRCRRCGKEGHLGKNCESEVPCCVNCQGRHESQWGSCPRRIEQIRDKQRSESRKLGERGAQKALQACRPIDGVVVTENFGKKSYAAAVNEGIRVQVTSLKGNPEENLTVPVQDKVTETEVTVDIEKIIQEVISRIKPLIETAISEAVDKGLEAAIPLLSGLGEMKSLSLGSSNTVTKGQDQTGTKKKSGSEKVSRHKI